MDKVSPAEINLIVEEMDGIAVEFQGKGLQERYVVGHDFFIRKIKLMANYRIHMIV